LVREFFTFAELPGREGSPFPTMTVVEADAAHRGGVQLLHTRAGAKPVGGVFTGMSLFSG